MKKELQLHIFVSDEIANHENNEHLDLVHGSFISYDGEDTKIDGVGDGVDCPPDTATGYYVKSGGNCVFVPYS